MNRAILPAVAIMSLAITGRGQPVVRIAPLLDPRVALTPIGAGDPAASLFEGEFASLAPISFYLSNSGRPILSVVLVYKLYSTVGQSGVFRTARYIKDGFNDVRLPPVIQAQSRVLVAGTQLLRPQDVDGAVGSQTFMRRARQDLQKIMRSATIDIGIDSVIFSGGEVVGPDATGFTSELTARRSAASAIVALVNQAKLNGVPPSQALAGILSTQPNPLGPNQFAVWQKRYAQNLLGVISHRAFSVDDYLAYLTRLAPVPALFKTTGGKP